MARNRRLHTLAALACATPFVATAQDVEWHAHAIGGAKRMTDRPLAPGEVGSYNDASSSAAATSSRAAARRS